MGALYLVPTEPDIGHGDVFYGHATPMMFNSTIFQYNKGGLTPALCYVDE